MLPFDFAYFFMLHLKYVAAFVVASVSNNWMRMNKPFNPLLGKSAKKLGIQFNCFTIGFWSKAKRTSIETKSVGSRAFASKSVIIRR